ncbi:MAG: right-handed parallel beta-helix repeat-containing protein, partial [Planctomycetales bacterium]|nr:right-handed parallel beta-helix repeat-containing protein [Planctomycetales bacterium]
MAANVSDRWDLVGDRLAVPVGARQVAFRFESIRVTGTTNDAYLDNAFVYLLPESVAPDYGAFGHSDEELPSAGPHVALRYPDLYVDWQRDVAKTIRWQSYDNSANAAVRIDLLQDTVHGPQFVTTIAASTPDDGELIWIPTSSGVNFDTPGLRIQVSLIGNSFAFDRAQESFTVPDNSTTFFVDDAGNAGDEFTLAAIGSNRNTGKTVTSPKPHPVNLLRAYNLPSGAVVSIDTGSYPLFDPIRISGSTDLGLGLEEAFTLRGPTDTAKHVTINWIYPDALPQALVELSGADFMTLSNLDLIGSQRGLWVTGNSNNFAASFITAKNQTLNAIDITPNNAAASFVGLVAENAGRHGIVISGEFAGLTDGRSLNNVDRGIKLTGSGNAFVEAMEVSGNRIGIDVTNGVAGTQTVIGNTDLSLARGNIVHQNQQQGIVANASGSGTIVVAGNSVYGHKALLTAAIQSGFGTQVLRNVVFDNQTGIFVQSGAPVRENRVYGNFITGISAGAGSPITSNVVYNNPTGILATASTGLIANNLIYNNSTGLKLSQGNGADVVNNTVYQATAGNGIRIESFPQNIELRNNILWAAAGTGVSISNDSQVGLTSDFNLLYASGTGVVGNWLGANQATLQQWQIATGRDANSLSNDPLFVDFDGADNVLGYIAGTTDGRDDDFHLQSIVGSFHGGSLAPVLDVSSGLPVFSTIAQAADAALSPAIDRGSAADPLANEPSPNGGFINIGAYGNTPQASLSPSPLLLLLDPNGGEIVTQNSTFPIRWRANGFAGNVLLEVSSTGAGGPFSVLAAGEANDGQFDWPVDAGTFPASASYFLRISSEDQPAVFDLTDAAFEVAAPTNAYYVNISGDVDFTDNEYTTAAGNIANTGLSPSSPLASIQAVLNAYDLEAGDVIYVDTGIYTVTTNIAIGAADSGVRIQGPVAAGHFASLDRNNTATGSNVFELQAATGVTLDSLVIFGANQGVLVDLASHDFTITRSIVRNNTSRGIHIEDTSNRAVIAGNEIHSHTTLFSIAVEIEGDDAVIRNNTIRNNTSNTGIGVTSTAANTLVRENDLFGNAVGINANQPSSVPSNLLIEANSVHGNNGSAAINVIGGGLVLGNDVFSNVTNFAIQLDGRFAEARDNTVHGTTGTGSRGIRLSQGATARDNRVFGNAGSGIEAVEGNVLGNVIYSNNIGILVSGAGPNQIGNNVIYTNTTAGIDHSGSSNSLIVGNTFYQVAGDAIRNVAAGSVAAKNNIFVIGSGAALNIGNSGQATFSSDYNLFQVIGSGRIATWGSTNFTSWQEWQFATGNDQHGFEADPLLTDPDGVDNVLGNEDDDFHPLPGSPALNTGDPLAIYGAEPASGNVADLGAFGNDAEALASSAQRIQLVEPGTFQKIEIGQPVNVRWIASGLTNPAPVVLLDAGGSGVFDTTSGRWSAEAYRRGFSQTGSFTQSVDVSAVTNPPPLAVLQKFVQANGSVGQPMRYDVPLADGDYQIRLFFVDPTATAANQRRFDVTLQGQTVLTNYDIFADAGATRKAVAKTFTFTASEGGGLQLDLTNRTSGFNATAIINAFEITRVDAGAPVGFTVNLEFSPDNGQNWTTIATNLTPGRFGDGQFTWIADQTTQGHTGLFRATAVGSGLSGVTSVSPKAVAVSNAANTFYINTASDVDFSDNEYTTAAGNDLNSGTSPDSPLASLSVLLRNYDLGPGDTVFVDSGTYNLTDNIEITSIHAGVLIQGPTASSHAAVLNRGNTSTGNYVFHLKDAPNVTLDSLELIGGNEGLRIDLASHDATLSNSIVRNNLIGVNILSSANRAVLAQNEFYANTGTSTTLAAVIVSGDDAIIEDNSIHDNAGQAVYVDNPAANVRVHGNDIFANPFGAVFLNGTAAVVEQNTIHSNATSPITQGTVFVASASAIVQDNLIFDNGQPGISTTALSFTVQRNVIHDNTDGIATASSNSAGIIRDNRIFHNSRAGIRLTASGSLVSGNSLYANATGIVVVFSFGGGTTTITNNLIYDHTSAGIEVNNTATSTSSVVKIHNNTVFEPVTTAVRLIAGPNTDVRNNVLSTESGVLFNVANSAQAGLTSDYNVLHISSGGNVGVWGTDNIVNSTDWNFELGRDQHSVAADPQFVDIDGPDNHRGYDDESSTDFGADDNFHEQTGSPAVDAGDTLSYYLQEPVSGNRINAGAFGNTIDATDSPNRQIQLTSPVGWAKFEVGQAVSIEWLSSGFTNSVPVALINTGGSAIADPVSGRWGDEAFRTGGTIGTITNSIDTSLLTTPPPEAVLATFVQGPSNQIGVTTSYNVPLLDGNYTIRLIFVEPFANAANQRKFDVALQGQTVLTNYDVFADAGDKFKAVSKSFSFSATGGTGLQLDMINRLSSGFGSVVSGIEITKANSAAPALFAANIEFSVDSGQTWTTIASNVPSNRFGEGDFIWNATAITNGNSGRFRITAVNDGVPTNVQSVSDSFMVADNGTSYYVNVAADSNLSDNEYTTAAGNNFNDGKSPASPMNSLAALVRAYDLDAGDTVFVDTGSYATLTNVLLGSEDSGVTIQGPTAAGHTASLTRNNTPTGNYVFELTDGATGITIDSVEILGAEDGVHISNASDIEIRNSVLRNNANRGVYV